MTSMPALLLLLYVTSATEARTTAGDDSELAESQCLSRMDNRLHKLEQENQELKAENQELRGGFAILNKKVLALEVKNPDIHFKSDHVASPRDVATRSDDPSPLEAVVAGLSQQVTSVSGEVQVLRSVDQQHSQAIQQAATSTYTRWGHAACPPDNNLLYSGVVGGSDFSESGGAVNYLCLSLNPVLSDHAVPSLHANLYGGEYETEDTHHDKDSLCAVCRSPRPNTILVPGTNQCMAGWTLEYSGYLMSERSDLAAGSEFVCVDNAMMSRPTSGENLNGKLFYFTVTHCGSLPCDPYINNKVVTCAVCSQ